MKPITITLGAADSLVVLENLEVFKMNGFRVEFCDQNTF